MDLALSQEQASGRFDLALDALGDLATDSGLRGAVIVSLFTDRRANADDTIPDGTDDRRGWWADGWPEVYGDFIGSRLWLLDREKQTADVPPRAREYAEEALAWLVEDGAATAVTVTAEWVGQGILGLRVVIRLAAGGRYSDVFDYPLEAA